MACLPRRDSICQTAERPRWYGAETEVVTDLAIGATYGELVCALTLPSPGARVNGAVPCIHDFIAARQRMLQAWQRLQELLPAAELAEEERATASAMRQLRQLQEGACHEPR